MPGKFLKLQSRLYLPRLASPPSTIFEYLVERFPHVPSTSWLDRFSSGTITDAQGSSLTPDNPYRYGLTVYYERENTHEPAAAETETILFQDSEILVADKPHGMPVTPAGAYVHRCLLHRVAQTTGISTIAPIHRLDRETAGVVLLSLNPQNRGQYHGLFARGEITREYLAVAPLPDTTQRAWRVENRIGPGDPWFRQQIIEGPPNSATAIALLSTSDGRGLFRLLPSTGKKHQLRLHMASIGAPVEGDPLYPVMRDRDLPSPRMQLLANRLTFTDPCTGTERDFPTGMCLNWSE